MASAYVGLSEILYVTNIDTIKPLCELAKAIAEKSLAKKTSDPIKKSLLKSLAISLNNIGYVYVVQGDVIKALEYYHKALNIQKEIGDKKGVGGCFNNIGAIYKDQGDIPKALKYFHKSFKKKKKKTNVKL